jgi:hypothetical protein
MEWKWRRRTPFPQRAAIYIYIEESGVRGGEAELLMIAIEE